MLRTLLSGMIARILPAAQGRSKGVFLTSDSEGRSTGVRLKWRSGAPGVIDGAIASFEAWSQAFRFFVADGLDTIQNCYLRGRFYEQEELSLIRAHFSGGLFVDVGSNVGNHTVFAARVLKASRVVAVEPNALAAEMWEINVALNGCNDAASLHRVGLSDRRGEAALSTEAHNLGGTRLVTGDGGDIPLVPGDELLAKDKVSFIKIDVEGHEIQVLQGLSGTIRRCRPGLFVEVENANAAAFESYCSAEGYRVVERLRRYPGCENLLAVHSQEPPSPQ